MFISCLPYKTLCTMKVRTVSVTSPWIILPPEQWLVCKVCIIGCCYFSAGCSCGLQGSKRMLCALRWCFTSMCLRIRALICFFLNWSIVDLQCFVSFKYTEVLYIRTCECTYKFFQILFHNRLLKYIEYSSIYYRVESCYK